MKNTLTQLNNEDFQIDPFDICGCHCDKFVDMQLGSNTWQCNKCGCEFKVNVGIDGIYSTTCIVGNCFSFDKI